MFIYNQNLSEVAVLLNLNGQDGDYHGPCPSCGYKSGFSMSEKSGKTLVYCHAGGCNHTEIFGAIRKVTSNQVPLYNAAISATPAKSLQRAYLENNQPAIDCDKKVEYIQNLWSKAVDPKKTLIEKYLLKRGITIPIPPSIKFLAECGHSPSGDSFPVMVAKATNGINDEPLALHRTYLKSDGSGKADVNPNKMILGQVNGLGIYLAPLDKVMAVTEGIENALTIYQETGISTVAALSAVGIENLVLPPQVKEIIICADNDPVGIKSANIAAKKWSQENRRVKIATVPENGHDFNDYLTQSGGLQ